MTMRNEVFQQTPSPDNGHAGRIDQFFKDCAAHLDPGMILLKAEDISRYQENVTGYKREILGIIRPTNTADVVNVVATANVHQVALYPISTGKNWGLGSRLPAKNSCVVVDLSGMNRIIEHNDTFGYMTIEPGVTQRQASEHLRSRNSSFMIDVTGAGSDTSIMGNLLERGIGYNARRVDSLVTLEVVLGTGEILKTGFAHYENSTIKHLYKYGIGCDLNGLFLQSNFGIVVSATVELLPKCDSEMTVVLNFTEQQLPSVIEKLRALNQASVLSSIAHIGNKTRQITILGPLLHSHYKRLGKPKSKAEIEGIIDDIYPCEWTLLAGLRGKRDLVRAAKQHVYRELKSTGTLKILSDRAMSVLEKIANQFPAMKLPALLSAASSLRGLTKGIPTQDTMPSLAWYYSDDPMGTIDENPDRIANVGMCFCLPFCPFEGDSLDRMLKTIYEITAEYQLDPAITLNTVSRNIVEAVVSIHFDRSQPQKTNTAKSAMRALNKQLIAAGFNPYRTNIDDMDLLFDENDSFWQLIRDLKSIFDPKHIIAPGRYNLV